MKKFRRRYFLDYKAENQLYQINVKFFDRTTYGKISPKSEN